MATKYTRIDATIILHAEKQFRNKAEEILSIDCFYYRLLSKSEWEGSHPVKIMKNKK